jgi:hypothetical protein
MLRNLAARFFDLSRSFIPSTEPVSIVGLGLGSVQQVNPLPLPTHRGPKRTRWPAVSRSPRTVLAKCSPVTSGMGTRRPSAASVAYALLAQAWRSPDP